MTKCIKFKIGEINCQRLLKFIKSEQYIQKKTITEHWSKRRNGNEKSFVINNDEIIFYTDFNTGLSYNYANYIFKKKNILKD